MVDFDEKVVAALTDPEAELWFPHLTNDLAQTGWRKLKDEIGLDKSDYGTARVLLKTPCAMRRVPSHISVKPSENSVRDLILVEELPGVIARPYKNSGIDFYESTLISPNGTVDSEILNCLCDAFNIIQQATSLNKTVIELVRSIHLIKPVSDDYDVSFSEPHIPFSIFISIPQKNNKINAFRVAEAIVHEAMHLQLTLVEGIIPLVSGNEENFYSPWKEEFRTAQGVLHALYVFRVITVLMDEIESQKNLVKEIKNHARERSRQIRDQISEINNFEDCPNLTEIGQKFVKILFTS
ncbi:MAG TPA: HEXXH motif-containing putative peptide modification protein [Pyrinomonadaceae bacterium]